MIRLSKEAKYATNVITICLPTEEKIVLDNLLKGFTDQMTITGWSSTELDVLLKATVSLIPHSSCQKEFNNTEIDITDGVLCNSNFNLKGLYVY